MTRFDLEPLECARAMGNLWEYLDAELEPSAHRAISAHVQGCERCSPRVTSSHALVRALKRAGGGVRAPAEFRRKVFTMWGARR